MIKVLEQEYLNDNFINKKFISNMSIKDKVYFKKGNIYYFGNYKEEKLSEIKNKLNKNKKSLIKAIESGVKFIVCANSFELFNNSFKVEGLNLFTSYNPRMFKSKINKVIIKNDKVKYEIKKVNDLTKVIASQNFMYKNFLCIKNPKIIESIIKRQSNVTSSC